jgi:phospholipase/carboxylesterase
MLDSFSAQRDLPMRTWNLMGFSQGAAVASTMALLHPERVERVALLAGFVPRGAEELAAGFPLRSKQVLVAHGSLDKMVDIELGRQAVQLLESAGARVLLCEDDVGHKVSAECMRRLATFFA